MNKKKYQYKRPNFFQRNFSFAGKMTAVSFWSELGIRIIEFLCAAILLSIALVVVIPGDTEKLTGIVDTLIPVLGIIWTIPIIAMSRRRLRDAGYDAKSYLWLLVPVIGWILFIVRLFRKSAANPA